MRFMDEYATVIQERCDHEEVREHSLAQEMFSDPNSLYRLRRPATDRARPKAGRPMIDDMVDI